MNCTMLQPSNLISNLKKGKKQLLFVEFIRYIQKSPALQNFDRTKTHSVLFLAKTKLVYFLEIKLVYQTMHDHHNYCNTIHRKS